jgi:hypothetical protein
MLQILKKIFGNTNVSAATPRIGRKTVDGEIVEEGDSSHDHNFVPLPWDREKYGPDVCNMDKDYGAKIEFPMATYKDLYSCSCGRRIVASHRALI